MKAVFKNAFPYAKDALNLPVADVGAAIPFYETVMGFQVVSRQFAPRPSVILGRDRIQIGLAENGGDQSQEGCFFEVDSVEAARQELKSDAEMKTQRHGDQTYRVFFVIAPDGLCYCLGEKQA